jgi:sulfate adenylyltransferase
MISPHGGKLIQLLNLSHAGIDRDAPVIPIDFEDYMSLENIATGVFSPLEGFMGRDDYESVLKRGRLADDLAWTIPILLHVRKDVSGKALLEFRGEIIGAVDVTEIFEINKEEYCEKIFGTNDKNHPGAAKIHAKSAIAAAGRISLFKRPSYPVFANYHLTPKETRLLFKERGWKTVVAFQTRNVPHLGHEYVQKSALTVMDGLFINPLMGKKKKGDFKDEVILNTYNILIENYYPKERAVMSVLPCAMHYAGPREAVFHALMRKNYGCTHFIVGRDHAGVGDYYGPFDAHRIFEKYPDIKIEPIFFKSFFKCEKCSAIANDKTCPHPEEFRINFSGTSIRNILLDGNKPSPDIMRPEVAEEILRYDHPFVD